MVARLAEDVEERPRGSGCTTDRSAPSTVRAPSRRRPSAACALVLSMHIARPVRQRGSRARPAGHRGAMLAARPWSARGSSREPVEGALVDRTRSPGSCACPGSPSPPVVCRSVARRSTSPKYHAICRSRACRSRTFGPVSPRPSSAGRARARWTGRSDGSGAVRLRRCLGVGRGAGSWGRPRRRRRLGCGDGATAVRRPCRVRPRVGASARATPYPRAQVPDEHAGDHGHTGHFVHSSTHGGAVLRPWSYAIRRRGFAVADTSPHTGGAA